MIQLWKILIPTADNSGKPFSTKFHQVWDCNIYSFTGGLTIQRPVLGKWSHSGKVYSEHNIPVLVACTKGQLKEILKFTKKYYNQVAVMAFLVSREVIII